MKNTETKAILGKHSASSLLEISQKSRWALLAEQFLLKAWQKQKVLLSQTSSLRRRLECLGWALSVVPLAFFFSARFSVEEPLLAALRWHNWLRRLFLGFSMGMACSLVCWARKDWKQAFFITGFFLFVFWGLPKEELELLIYDKANARALISFLLAAWAVPPAWGLAWLLVPKKSKEEKELKLELEQALAQASSARREEIAEKVRDHMPEYTSLLEQLKAEDPDLAEFVKPTADVPEPPKEMAMPLYLGTDIAGAHHTIDIASLPHLLVGGASGKGKSNFLTHLISTFLERADVELVLLDGAQVEFAPFENEKGVSYASEFAQAKQLLEGLLEQMKEREVLLKEKGLVKLSQLTAEQRPPRQLLVVDEYATFSSSRFKSDFQDLLSELARKGRKCGIHLVLCMQRPDNTVLDMQVRSNLSASLAFGVADKKNAEILRAPGAEKLEKPGQAYFVFGTQRLLLQTPKAPQVQLFTSAAESIQDESPENVQLSLLPAQPDTPAARFVVHAQLEKQLGAPPRKHGFTLVRRQHQGKRQRGYWVVEPT